MLNITGDTSTEQPGAQQYLLPALLLVTVVLVAVLNSVLIQAGHSLLFDPLFYIPIIFIAYYYPGRGVYGASAIAGLYLGIVLTSPLLTPDMIITAVEHAGLFILVGSVLSHLSTRSPHDLLFHRYFAETIEPSRIRITVIPPLLAILVAGVLLTNYLVLTTTNTLIFDPLFYFPVILVAYFYPRYGVYAAAAIAGIYLSMIGTVPSPSAALVITGYGHAGFFILTGSLVSYLNTRFSRDMAIQRRLAEIMQSSVSDAIIGKGLDGTITFWNNGAERLYGWTAAEVIGKPITILFPKEQAEEARQILATVQQGAPVNRYETVRVNKDGRKIFVSVSVSPVFNDRGAVIGAAVLTLDITERRQAEDALRQANKKLNLLNAITFTDIRNAVFSLSGYLHMEQDGFIPPAELASFREKEIWITKEVENWIKFAQNYQDLGIKPPFWQNVHHTFLFGISHVDLQGVTRRVELDSLEIFADPLLENVFFALADNAARHGKTVTEIALSCRETGEGLTIVFTDNGTGIPAGQKERIFLRRDGEKKGMGLYFSREILSITGITIRETGEPGKGARFEIVVPKGAYRFGDSKP